MLIQYSDWLLAGQLGFDSRQLQVIVFCVRFKVLMAVNGKSAVYWSVTPCSLVEGYLLLEEHTASIFKIEL
jgi:hypothetical protein